MDEEFIYPSDEELAASFVDDLFSAFMVEIKKYPVLSIDEQKELVRKYRNGDMSARETLVNHNLRLVVYVASAYKNRIQHLKIMDIIQEGSIGLMRAIDKYDPDVGAFSTYAINWIRQAITRAIDDGEDEIRKPVHMSYRIRKYRYLCSTVERKHTPMPDDKELMKFLDCSKETLELIKEKAKETVVSAQTKINDEDNSELGDFIPDKRNDFDEVLNNINDQGLLAVIKSKLRPIEYYFLYNYEINKQSDDATLESLASEFNVTRERVRQIKAKAYEKAGKYVKNKKLRGIEVKKIEESLGMPITKTNVMPVNINNIVLYALLHKDLSSLEERILAHILFSDIVLNTIEQANFFNISLKEYDTTVKKLRLKIKTCFEDHKTFEEEKERLINLFGTKIFNLVPIDEFKMHSEKDKKEIDASRKIDVLIKEQEEELKRKKEEEEQRKLAKERRLEDLKKEKRKLESMGTPDDQQEEKKRYEKLKLLEKEIVEEYAKKAQNVLNDSKKQESVNIFKLIDINNHDMLVAIKMRLSSLEYFIFYQVLKNKDNVDKAIKDLANLLCLNSFTVLAYKNRIVKKIEKFLSEPEFLNKEIKKLESKYNAALEEFKDEPIDPDKIILMTYFHDKLSDIEYQIFKLSIFNPTNTISREVLGFLDVSEEEYKSILNLLQEKMVNLIDVDKFRIFKKGILKTYGTKIFDKNFDKNFDDIDYENLKTKFDGKTFEEIQSLYGDTWEQLDSNSQNLLRRYFTIPENNFSNDDEWKDDFYLELNNINLAEKEYHLKPKVLYDCYLENRDNFSKNAQMFLECYVFETRDKSEYEGNKMRQTIATYRSILLDKLEKLYFNVHNILYSFDFTKEQWEKVLEKHENKFDEKRIIAMNMFYGIDGEAMSIPEIAEVFGVERDKMHDYLAKIRKKAIALYTNRANIREVDRDVYIPYVLNRAISFTSLNREILLMFLIQELDYEQIKEELKTRSIDLSKYQISNIVTEGLRKVDFYRFGIVKFDNYGKDLIERFIKENEKKLSQKEKLFIRDKYLNFLDNDYLAVKFKKKKLEVNRLVQRFNISIENFKARDEILTEDDYLQEFNTNPLERVVNEQQMHMLSYYYGVKCKYNPDGVKFNAPQMIKILPEYANDNAQGLARKIKKANDAIKRKKKNQLRNDLMFMSLEEISKIIDDPHLPISDKEKYLICSIYGIKKHKQKTLKDLSKEYDENESSIRRRYQRAFVAIFKYRNGEIPAKIDYDYDILPLMRYFSKYDRMLIEDSYKNGLSYEKMAKKYKLTFNQIVTRFNRLHLALYEMINYPKKENFDFDFFEKAIKDPLLPFYGNLEEAIKIFDLHFANTQVKNMSGREIVEELNLNREEKSVIKTIYNLIMAVCRYKYGIRKEYDFTYEDVKDYYMRHKNEMTATHEKYYLKYFKRHLKEDANRNRDMINKTILIDLLKERQQEYANIDEIERDDVVNLLKHRNFSTKVTHGLLNKIGETEKVIMSGQELNHVYRLLNRLDKTFKLNNTQALKRHIKRDI
ncbi:MAG: sigma-70 family RNA polymerase sigma factor [Bacilli bacterium]|nr:sigma-70 family RNA polymerase sigma factor [Bacilli bacterium]